MSVTKDFRAPALPLATRDYNEQATNQMANILRLYFNQLDQLLGQLAIQGASALTYSEVVTALGFVPEDVADKGIANGYAPLNSSTKIASTYLPTLTSGEVTTALGFTPENAANKGVANGYAPLNSSTKIANTYLPNPRVNSQASVSTLVWDSASYDQYVITALAGALTINADSNSSPVDGQKMIFRFKDSGTARALTWTVSGTNSFRVVGTTLPTTTVANKLVYIGCIYNAASSLWDVTAVGQEV